MRRLISLSVFALLLAVPAWAQRGRGHGGGGHIGGGGHAGGFSGHAGGSHFGGGVHLGGGHSWGGRGRAGFSRGFVHRSRGPFLHNGTSLRIRTRGFRHCFGYRCGFRYRYPWWYAGYYDPWWWSDNSSYDEDYYRNLAAANEMNQQSLEEQRVRRQEETEDRDSYAPRRSDASVANTNTGDPILPPTVLVFRDQRRQEIHNYAIVGQTLWSFGPQRTQKIALADLNLEATAKANDERGVDFRLPASNEAQ